MDNAEYLIVDQTHSVMARGELVLQKIISKETVHELAIRGSNDISSLQEDDTKSASFRSG